VKFAMLLRKNKNCHVRAAVYRRKKPFKINWLYFLGKKNKFLAEWIDLSKMNSLIFYDLCVAINFRK
jgi:hypothetical protein